MRLTLVSLCLSFCIALSAAAQPAACPALVGEALSAVGNSCGGLGRNQACYGNFNMIVTARNPVDVKFSAPGDTVDLSEVESLQLAALAPAVPEWGIALMALQANLPDTLPGQNLTVVLFGDVDIADASRGTAYGTMQAFKLRTGIGAPACGEAPASGILIQTPDGAGEVTLEINKVTVNLGSTAVVRAVPGDSMRFTILEGFSSVGTDAENTQLVLPFKTAVIPLDADGNPTGDITLEDAIPADFASLPLSLLPREVKTPATETGGTPFGTPEPIGTPEPAPEGLAGKWTYETNDVDISECPNGAGTTGASGEETLVINGDGTIRLFAIDLTYSDGAWHGTSTQATTGFTANNTYDIVFDGAHATAILTSEITNSALGVCVIRFIADMQHIE